MKKYVKPATDMMKIDLQQMIAVSGTVSISNSETVTDAAVAEGRKSSSIWDED